MAVRKQKNGAITKKVSKSEDSKKFCTDIRKYKQYIFVGLLAIIVNYLIVVIFTWENCNPAYFHKDAQSAIKRAKSPECKQKLKDVACAANSETLYPKEIQPTCDFYQKVNYVGCFQDNRDFRILNGTPLRHPNVMTPYDCVNHCYEQGYDYAGVQWGQECFCGNELQTDFRIPEQRCNFTCPGDKSQNCGGSLALGIYEVRENKKRVKRI